MTAIATPRNGPMPPRADAQGPLEERLATWAYEHLVNRTGMSGGYYLLDGLVHQTTRREPLDRDRLVRHFLARDVPGDVVGLHVSSEDETCRWVAADYDVHDERADDPTLIDGAAQLAAAWAARAGIKAVVEDSNGRGGRHVWLILPKPVPQELAWRLGKRLVAGWEARGLKKEPESFPKRPQLSGARCGNWLRLPGHHHKREHWSRFRFPAGRRGLFTTWCDWQEGARRLLDVRPRAVDLEEVLGDFDPRPRRLPATYDARRFDPGDLDDPEFVRSKERASSAVRHLELAAPELADGYDAWLQVGMALTGLGEPGLGLWHRFSRRSRKYDEAVLDAKWATFQQAADGATGLCGLGSLFHLATERGWVYGEKALIRDAYMRSKLAQKSSATEGR